MSQFSLTRPIALGALCAVLSGPAIAQSTGATGSTEGTGSAAATEAPAVDVTADTVVATVDGTDITLGEIIAVRQSLPDQYQGLPDEVLMNALISQLTDQQALADAATKAGLEKERSVNLALVNQRRAVMADAFMTDQMIARLTPERLEKAYEERYLNAEPVIEVRAAHILVPEEEQAKKLKVELDGGADFAALAAEHGTDGTRTRGGDLGWFVHEQMVPAFADAAFAMEPGTVSDPVQTQFGWHLIKLDGKREQPKPTLAEVEQELMTELSQEAQAAVIKEIRDGAEIVRVQDIPASAVRQDELLGN